MATPAPSLATRSARDVTAIDHALRHTASAGTLRLEHRARGRTATAHLAGHRTDLAALLADHLRHHTRTVPQPCQWPAAPHIARAGRDLAAAGQALDTTPTEARGYRTVLSHSPTNPPQPGHSS